MDEGNAVYTIDMTRGWRGICFEEVLGDSIEKELGGRRGYSMIVEWKWWLWLWFEFGNGLELRASTLLLAKTPLFSPIRLAPPDALLGADPQNPRAYPPQRPRLDWPSTAAGAGRIPSPFPPLRSLPTEDSSDSSAAKVPTYCTFPPSTVPSTVPLLVLLSEQCRVSRPLFLGGGEQRG